MTGGDGANGHGANGDGVNGDGDGAGGGTAAGGDGGACGAVAVAAVRVLLVSRCASLPFTAPRYADLRLRGSSGSSGTSRSCRSSFGGGAPRPRGADAAGREADLETDLETDLGADLEADLEHDLAVLLRHGMGVLPSALDGATVAALRRLARARVAALEAQLRREGGGSVAEGGMSYAGQAVVWGLGLGSGVGCGVGSGLRLGCGASVCG